MEFSLVRAPVSQATGKPFETCGFALFPGLSLAMSEPELVVLLYDSVLHQHPDTAMFLHKAREGSDPLLNRKWQQKLLTEWRKIGKPAIIIVSPEDMNFFRGCLGEIKTISLYDDLLAHGVSGGCSHELYRIAEPDTSDFAKAIREMAENMGAVIYDGDNSDISPEEAERIPYLTSSIDLRNELKSKGHDAVHILELIFGMGKSNGHLVHAHADGHDHDHSESPQVRDVVQTNEQRAAQAALFDDASKKQNLFELEKALLSLFWGETL
jgi:hypothetical protein